MITPFDIYLITRLDAIKGLFFFFTAIIIIVSVVYLIVKCINICENLRGDQKELAKKDLTKKMIKISIVLIFICVINTLIPATKTAVAIYMIPKIANNEEFKKLPNNTLKFLNTKLERWIHENVGEEDKK